MARISEYNVSFQEVQLLRSNVPNITESKTKRPPFFLPKMKLNEASTTSEKGQRPDIELDVRGLGKTGDKGFSKKGKRKQKKTRKRKNMMNSFPSPPSNKIADHKSPGFSLPPIDSKSLIHERIKDASGCSSTKTMTPQQEFDFAFHTLMSVIERSKQELKRTTERFQRNVVQGEQKPINEKVQSAEEAKTDS